MGWSAAIKTRPLCHPVLYNWVGARIDQNPWAVITGSIF